MTQKELDSEIFMKKMFIADRFKDIQSYAAALTTVEDTRWQVTALKIRDALDECNRVKRELEMLELEEPDDENADLTVFNNF